MHDRVQAQENAPRSATQANGERSPAVANPPERRPSKWGRTPDQVALEHESDEVAELLERNQILSQECDRMEARLAMHFMEATEEEKKQAEQMIAEQTKRITDLVVEARAIRTSRDYLRNENAELRKQCLRYRNQFSKYEGANARK